MKRSEMLEIISTTLDKTDFVDTEMCWTMRAEIVLKAIEKAGMLPPKSLDTITLKKGLVRGYTMMFEWEPEDE